MYQVRLFAEPTAMTTATEPVAGVATPAAEILWYLVAQPLGRALAEDTGSEAAPLDLIIVPIIQSGVILLLRSDWLKSEFRHWSRVTESDKILPVLQAGIILLLE